LDLRKPQKWVAWTVPDNMTATRHTTAKQVTQLDC
jgi:hypothetical protein